jgi:hypothetical protein
MVMVCSSIASSTASTCRSSGGVMKSGRYTSPLGAGDPSGIVARPEGTGTLVEPLRPHGCVPSPAAGSGSAGRSTSYSPRMASG